MYIVQIELCASVSCFVAYSVHFTSIDFMVYKLLGTMSFPPVSSWTSI